MGGKSPIVASDEQRVALTALAGSRDRGEADRARAVLLTLSGWSSPQIAEAFGVREDTVRLWRSDFGRGGSVGSSVCRSRMPSLIPSSTGAPAS
jgi:transposase